ncbi:MAG: hypothetical protein EPN88_15625 [Bacteroidetes bacterium]|nr:MAG: hypothetical protein EPN88_15625 [Bacteroidota bacterium]
MKPKTFFISLSFIIILSSSSLFSQTASLDGEWKLNKEKTVLADNQLFLSGIKTLLRNDSLLTTRIYENGNGEEYTFDENLSLDGKESKIVIYDMPRTSKASKSGTDGSLNIESTTVVNGEYGEENYVSKEIWKIDSEGKILTIDFKNKMSDNETAGTNFYNKVNP